MLTAQGRSGVEVVFDKFDKSKKKDTYKLLDIVQNGRFRIVTFQVDLPEEERKLLNQRLAKKAFLKQ